MVSGALRVLVVEDDELMLELYQCQFEIWALPVACSWMSSAADVLQGIDQLRPDLLITDLSMPGMDGQQMLRVRCTPPCKLLWSAVCCRSRSMPRGGFLRAWRF